MTTIMPFIVECGLCGQKSRHQFISSFSQFGEPDLDERPAAMFRGTMSYWVRECPHCGYVREQLSLPCEFSKPELTSLFMELEKHFSAFETQARYQWPSGLPRPPRRYFVADKPYRLEQAGILKWHLPENPCSVERILCVESPMPLTLAKIFAKYGKLLETLSNHSDAARQYLRAAWVFDDEQDDAGARQWREMAIAQTRAALAGNMDEQERAGMLAILADMLRRNGDFAEVLQLPIFPDLSLHSAGLLALQQALARAGNTAAHTLKEVPAHTPKGGGTFFRF